MVNSLKALIADSWATLNRVFYKFLVNPWLVSLLISFAIAMLLFSSDFTGRGWIVLALVLILVAYCLLAAPPLVALAEGILMHFVPADTGETVDAIVVIGRGQGEQGDRYDIAMQLLAEGRAPQLFVTGETNFQHVAALKNTYNISVDQLNGSRCGRTTQDEAEVTAVILGPQGIQTILLVTDRPHMLRAYLTFQGQGFRVIPYPISLFKQISFTRHSVLTLREYIAFISYALLGRLQAGTPENLTQPTAELVEATKFRGCAITLEEREQLFESSL